MAKKTTTQLKVSEHQVQSAFFQYLEIDPYLKSFRHLIFAIPNSGKRSYALASYMKKEGLTAGVLDVFVAIPRNEYHGLFIEFKVKPNKLTEKQESFRLAVLLRGYQVLVCYSVEDAINGLKSYLL